jgi:N-acyl-D-amino-acid deacylase
MYLRDTTVVCFESHSRKINITVLNMWKHILLATSLIFLISCGNNDMPLEGILYDLMIVNGQIVDGTGSKPYLGTVLIKDGVLSYVGNANLESYEANQVIDADGMFITPGFIDAHGHGNAELNPKFKNFWSMGVTTILLGMDGRSDGIDDFNGWMQNVESARPGVNIAPFTGHGTARNATSIGLTTHPSEEQITELKDLIEEQMQRGSFGVTKGIEYIPGRFADIKELTEIGNIVAEYNGTIMSHIRNEDADQVQNSIRELIEVGSKSGSRVHVSHIKIVYSNDEKDADSVVALVDSARKAGVSITADVYPYTASFTGIGILYPEWALPPNNFETVKVERRSELAEYLRNRVNLRNGPEATLLGTAPWSGKTLADISDEFGIPFEDVLIDHLPPGSASAAYFVMNIDVMRRFLGYDHVVVSSDGSPEMRHPRGYGSFARIIRQFVVEEEFIAIQDAVKKMSGQTASIIGLDRDRGLVKPENQNDLRFTKRGYLKTGFAADVLIFDPANIRDAATFENPHQYATGFDYVIINGLIVQADGESTGARPGLVLRAR